MLTKSQLKNILRRVLSIGLYAVDSLVLVFYGKCKVVNDRVAIVRLDNIGDWVLFQNVLPYYQAFYADKIIDVYINKACRGIVRDSDKIKYKYIDIKKLQFSLFYRLKLMRQLNNVQYRTVVNPTYSRNLRTSDSICRYLSSEDKVFVNGDASNSSMLELKISSFWYDRSVSVDYGNELDINADVVFKLTGLKVEPRLLNVKAYEDEFSLPSGRYVVFFIGTSQIGKTWSFSNFASVANYILQNTNFKIALCGSNEDLEITKGFLSEIDEQDRVINYVSKTSLSQLIYVISQSSLLVTGDTVASHLAAHLSRPQVCVAGLGQKNRFVPYPQRYNAGKFTVVEDRCKYSGCNWVCKFNSVGAFRCIDSISPEQVIEAVKNNLCGVVNNEKV